MLTITYFAQGDRRLLYALLLVAVVMVFPTMMALMPVVVSCCSVVLPILGKLLAGAVVIAVFAFVTKPR